MYNVFSCTTTKMLKYIILAILGTTVSAQAQAQCCDRRAPECQSQYSMCMSSTSADLQQRCESVFCASAPYPLPTTCCDQKLADCQAKYQECLVGTFGSFSLCAPTFCSTSNEPSRVPSPEFTKLPEIPTPAPTQIVDKPTPAPTRVPEIPTPAPTQIVDKPTPAPTRVPDMPTPPPTRVPEIPTRIPQLPSADFTKMPIPSIPVFPPSSSCCNRTSDVCNIAYNRCKQENGMFCESMFCDGPPMPSLPPPTDFTCCDRESEMCQKLHASCVSSGGDMCDMMYCERTPLPSRSAFPSRKPRPTPRFSAFPSPKFLRAIPSILPKEIQSSLKVTVKERKEIESITKIKEIQVKISCSLHMPLDNIKIKNITFIDASGIRNVIKFNEIEVDNADIPQVDCFAPQTNARMLQTSNVDIGYIVVDPTPELLAYDPVNLVSSVSNTQPSSDTSSVKQQSSSTNLLTVLASVFGTALAMVGLASMFAYIRARNKTRPIQTQERVIRVSVNPLEAVTSLPRIDSSRRQFGPQGARV